MLLEGIFVPLTTPFYPDGRLYLRKLEHNVDRYSRSPAAGMLVLGETGEADSLTDAETVEALKAAIAAAAKHKVMIAGVSRASVFATLILAEAAASARYDAVALKAPHLASTPSMQVQLMTYFRAVADRSPLPVIVLSEASSPLAADVLSELAAHPAIIAAVDPKASPARLETIQRMTAEISRDVTVTPTFAAVTRRMLEAVQPSPGSFVSADSLGKDGTALALAPPAPALKTRTKRVGFQTLAGSSRHMLQAWTAGATGAVPPLAACTPQGCCEVWQAFKDGDILLAEEKQAALQSAATLVEGPPGIPALKHACDLNGYFGGRSRLPRLTLTADGRVKVESALATLHN